MKNPTNSLQRVAAGNVGAVQECIDAHSDLVWGMVRRYGRQGADAEREVAEVFSSLWMTASSCPDGESGELAFVATSVRRHLLRIDYPLVVDMGPGADVSRVEQRLRAMSPEQQSVLGACLADGYSPAEVAAHLGLAPGVVRGHLRSGLAAISAVLSGETSG